MKERRIFVVTVGRFIIMARNKKKSLSDMPVGMIDLDRGKSKKRKH